MFDFFIKKRKDTKECPLCGKLPIGHDKCECGFIDIVDEYQLKWDDAVTQYKYNCLKKINKFTRLLNDSNIEFLKYENPGIVTIKLEKGNYIIMTGPDVSKIFKGVLYNVN